MIYRYTHTLITNFQTIFFFTNHAHITSHHIIIQTTTIQKTITGKTITVSGDAEDEELQRVN